MNTTPSYSNVSTCCNVFPLTCRIHCLGRLERHNSSVFLVLIFVPVGRSRKPIKCVLKTLLRTSMHALPHTNSSAKSKRFILQFPTVTPSSTRLWLSIQFMQTRALQTFGKGPHRLLHNSSRANILRNVRFSGYVTFYLISNFFVNTVFFHY